MSHTPQLSQDFERLIRAFESIAKLPSNLQRQYWISRTAKFHDLTRADMRRLFAEWLQESAGEVEL